MWIHKVGLRFHTHQRCVCLQTGARIVGGSQHTQGTTPPSAAATAAPTPSTRLRDAAAAATAATAAALRRHAGSVAASWRWASFGRLVLQRHPGRRDTQAGRNLEDSKAMDDRTTMEAMRPAAQRPRQSAGSFRGLDLRLATLRPPDRLETCSFFRDKATFRSVCRCTAALCDR